MQLDARQTAHVVATEQSVDCALARGSALLSRRERVREREREAESGWARGWERVAGGVVVVVGWVDVPDVGVDSEKIVARPINIDLIM
jgi:hypothetical protein